MDRSVELTGRARDAADAAATAAEHMRIRYNPTTVANRIREISAELRGLGRRRDAAGERELLIERGVPATDIGLGGLSAAGAVALEEQHRYLTAQLEHWTGVRAEQIRDGAATNYGPVDLRPGDLVLHQGRWYPAVRVNAKSVTVPSLLGDWTDTVRYEHITDIARADDPRRAEVRMQAVGLARAFRGPAKPHRAWVTLEERLGQ